MRYNCDFGYEKPRRSNSGKKIRIVILFCIVAAVTAAVIYAIIPEKTKPVPPDEALSQTLNANENSDPDEPTAPNPSETGNDAADNENIPADNADTASTDAPEKPEVPALPTPPSDQEKNAPSENTAKFDPNAAELRDVTNNFRAALANGSWTNDAVEHVVVSGDVLSKLAVRYHTTVSFIQKYNNIEKANDIRIGQRIFFLRADSWQAVISRKNSTVTVERIVDGKNIPFAIFPCRISADKNMDMVICSRVYHPTFTDSQGRRISYSKQGNPYGEMMLALANSDKPNDPIRHLTIHGSGDPAAVESAVKGGSIALSNDDIAMLYHLLPVKTPVKIVD